MKRVFTPIFLSLLLLSAAVLPAGARNVKSLYELYADKPGAESVSVGRFWINLAKLVVAFGQEEAGLSDDETDIALKTLSHINAVRVADLSGCSEKVLAQFAEDVEKCETGDYVVLTEVHDDGDDARVLVRKDGDIISELVVISAGDDPAIIQIEGKITEEEAAKYIASSIE
ncbi:MAG TPA: DUF4252 domain-containing protein [Candidatus Coprenecus pullistercoris]|nr:DUF4252 domain-containing protein [Candidatus Coprenecus pullistercoris]